MTSLLLAILISTSIDSTQMQLGQQSNMRVEVRCDRAEDILSMDFRNQFPQGLEAVKTSPVDTTTLSDGQVLLAQEMVVAGFRDSTYEVAPYVVTHTNDTIRAAINTLRITTPQEVAQMQDIHDIKPIEYVAIWWWDVVKWILLAIGIAVIGAVGYILWKGQQRRQGKQEEEFVPSVPAEVEALERLQAIEQAKIWQQGHIKQYHSELTDVVRHYIGRRYDVHSTEKTSDETLRSMKPLLSRELHTQLSTMLQLADFVKFAKYQASPDENEQALRIAFDFVQQTTPQPEPSLGKEDKK